MANNGLQSKLTAKKIILLLILLVSAAGIGWQVNRAQDEVFSPIQLKPELLTGDDYIAARDTYAELVNIESPQVALATFQTDLENDTRLLNSCHPISHYIGNTAHQKLGFTEAMEQINSVCNSGYIHGVVESEFLSLDDIESGLREICNDFEPSTRTSWQCSHGVGHGVMFFTNNDLPRALTLCSSMPHVTQTQSCKNGVMMENFLADGEYHKSEYIRAEDPFYPCEESFVIDAEARYFCYTYAPSQYLLNNPGDYEGIMRLCGQTEQLDACFQGSGTEILEDNINEPVAAISYCQAYAGRYAENCAEGVYRHHASQFQATDKIADICHELGTAELQDDCTVWASVNKNYFEGGLEIEQSN